MKNHISVNGKLLQTNKKFSQLKNSQKEKISQWLFNAYTSLAKEDGALHKRDKEALFSIVERQIEEADIWIPFEEVVMYFEKKRALYRKRFLKKQNNMTDGGE